MSDLQKFVDAQDPLWDSVIRELTAGRKASHWMWFVFPQVAGLGMSPTAQHYALDDAADAREYLAHPVLGPRLRQACEALLALPGSDPVAVLGSIDAMKLRSSMTLFEVAALGGERGREGDLAAFADLCGQVLERYYGGERDERTIALA